MFTPNEVFAAFIFGWLACAVSVVIGGWIEKIETRLERQRSKNRCRRCYDALMRATNNELEELNYVKEE